VPILHSLTAKDGVFAQQTAFVAAQHPRQTPNPNMIASKNRKTLSSQNNPNHKQISNIDLQNSYLESATIKSAQRKAPNKSPGLSYFKETITRNPLIHNILRITHLNGIFYRHTLTANKTKQER
jgi:hypothetical protein